MLDKISSKDILGGKIKKVDIVNIDKFLDYFFFFFKYLELNVNDISFLNKYDIVVII